MLVFQLGKVLHNYLNKLLYSHIDKVANLILFTKYAIIPQPKQFYMTPK